MYINNYHLNCMNIINLGDISKIVLLGKCKYKMIKETVQNM